MAEHSAAAGMCACPDGLFLTPELFDEFLDGLQRKSRTPDTLLTYRRSLNLLYEYLQEEKLLCRGTLDTWRNHLLESGYAPRTVNRCISAANSLLEYCGRRELQAPAPLKLERAVQPELTRSEYLRLLSTARTLGWERVYLLVKVFGSMGLTLRELPRLTVEAVKEGRLYLSGLVLHIPACLQKELLDFADRKGVMAGPLFVTRSGTPIRRTTVTAYIQRLARDACVPPEKCNPRCLRKLYLTTQENIRSNLSLLIEQAHDRMLETEQLAIGWKDTWAAAVEVMD